MSREGATVNKVLYDAALWREHDGWVTYKCNAEQMPRYAMLEAYGSPPIEKSIQASLDAAYAEGLRDAAKQVPTNWCDELLSGKTVSKLPWNSSNIEQLLRGVQQRIERLAQQAGGGAHGTHEQRGRTGGGTP